jgi:thiamine pyrophosphokinase
VIGADSGVATAVGPRLRVDLAIGDFDSLDPCVLAEVARAGAVVERHPVAKDATDLELALDAAVDRGATRVIVVGGHGGRLDHLLANALALAAPAPRRAWSSRPAWGDARVWVARPDAPCRVAGAPGDDRLPAPGRGVRPPGSPRPGLAYELRDGELGPGTTRGVSNEMTGASAAVRLTGGTLLVVVPGTGRVTRRRWAGVLLVAALCGPVACGGRRPDAGASGTGDRSAPSASPSGS